MIRSGVYHRSPPQILDPGDPPGRAMTGQAYTRSLGCGARSSGLVRVLGGLVFLPARSVSPGEARARNVMSWLEAWKKVEQAISEPRRRLPGGHTSMDMAFISCLFGMTWSNGCDDRTSAG
jgi:hypothetical protein